MSNDYTINKYNGNLLTTVTSGTANTTVSSLTLIGKNYTGYGAFLNENFVYLLENFANTSAPSTPLPGQIWYDSGNNVPKIYTTSSTWKNIGSATAQGSAPTGANQGDLWYDTVNKQLNGYNGSSWDLVGPDYTVGQTLSGQKIETITDTLSGTHVAVVIYGATNKIAIYSADAEYTPNPAITGFTTIKPGLNLNSTLGAKVADADLLDGLDSTQFMRSDTNTSTSGNLSVTNSAASTSSSTGALKVTVGGAGIAGNIYAGGNIVATGNLSGTNVAGTLTTAAQPNVTSLGTLTGLTVSSAISGNINGNAGTATALQTARQINGVSFNGTADITVTAAAGTLTGTTLNATVVNSSLTSLGTLSSLVVSGTSTSGNLALTAGNIATTAGNLTLAPVAGSNVQITANANITSSTDTASLTTGALVVAGGVAVGGKLRANLGLYTDSLYYANGTPYSTSSGTVNSGTATQLAYYVSSGTAVSETGTALTFNSATSTLNVTKMAANVGYCPTLTLTDSSTIAWNTANGQVAKVTLAGNRTVAAPTNLLDGAFYNLMVVQDGTGSRTLSWNSVFKWIGGSAPDLSTTAGAIDFFSFRSDGTYLYEQGRAQEVA